MKGTSAAGILREASTVGISTRGKRCASHTYVYFLPPPPTTNVPSFFSSIFARDPRCHTRTRGRTKRSDGCEYEEEYEYS